MAFNNLIIRLTSEARALLGSAPTVIELGNQTFSARGDILERLCAFLKKYQIAYDEGALDSLVSRNREGDRERLTESYFKALGFASYDAIDVNSRHGSLIMDLNCNLRVDYEFDRTFDLVTNNGTGEHIFDQCSVFQNMHELTKQGGVMVHCLPCNNYINHGFFSFSPSLFMDLAAINGYDILKITVGSSGGYETGYVSSLMPAHYNLAGPDLSLDGMQRHISGRSWPEYLFDRIAKPLGLIRGRGPYDLKPASRGDSRQKAKTLVAAVLRKQSQSKFRKPIQGRYGDTNIESETLRETYRME